MFSLRISGPFLLTALLTATLSPQTHAQSPQTPFSPVSTRKASPTTASADAINIAAGKLPDAPSLNPAPQPPEQQPDPQHSGSISGIVEDANGAEVPDAVVALENTDSKFQRTLTTDATGSFKFDSVEPGKFK